MFSLLTGNIKFIIIGLVIVAILGTFAYQKYKITSLEKDIIVYKNENEKLKAAVDIANASIETCNNGKNALEQEIKDINKINENTLKKVTKIDLTFKNALNQAVKKEQISDKKNSTKILKDYLQNGIPSENFTVMSKEKSDETINLYNDIFKPFIKEK